jgi:hypothetical protein
MVPSFQHNRRRLHCHRELDVFVDLPRWLVTTRNVRRTLRRASHRTELWNGCRKAALRTIFTDRDHVVRWSVRTHPD